ncbi:diacylglycerol kinase A-like [Condylostylus longicornis]|uniref:diacylglycerol kinase A-like n=1 Tax=Condylostylus longicornis TaxID=2530218 RepID=UPI00244DF3D9|nr:diacylglycerol kinase A-like [Condylostylus longicornis]
MLSNSDSDLILKSSPVSSSSQETPSGFYAQTLSSVSSSVQLLVNGVETQIREETETRRSRLREPSEASLEAAMDRLALPHLAPLELAQQVEDLTVDPAKNVFLFVNPMSGGNQAAAFMEAGLEHIRLTVSEPVNLWIWDIRQGSSGKKPGFYKLKKLVDALNLKLSKEQNTESKPRDEVVYVIVAGGDGTVMWCVTEMWVHGIDDDRIALGVVPYGTGNDFARALGWQKFNAARPYDNKFKVLKELVREWLQAKIVWHDIWEVSLKVQPEGTFQKIDASTRRKKPVTGILPVIREEVLTKTISTFEALGEPPTHLDNKILRLKMCNYFSCGIESRVGIGFDRHRTKSQFFNKMMYGIEGGKKAFFKPTQKINDITDTLIEGHGRNRMKSLIVSNIPSFAAGLDLWGTTKNIGVKPPPESTQHQQKLGDGEVEFIAFSGVVAMGIERVSDRLSRPPP